MLSLSEQHAKLSNLNIRAEVHGEDHVTAADLKLELKAANSILAEFDPVLKSFLYEKDEDQADLVSAEDPEHVTRRRFPKLGPLKWDDEIIGAKVTIDYGANSRSDVVLHGCAVNDFRIEPQEGGTVCVALRVQAHPDEKQIAKLAGMIQTDVVLSIEPPAPAEAD